MKPNTSVRVGVIGTSWWANGMHLPALKSHPDAEIAAICGRNRVRVEEMAQTYEISNIYEDYRQMIAEAGLDAVVVSTPDDLHHAMVMAALDAKLHVLCEKPLALNAAHAREMATRAAALGVVHMTYFSWRWLPYFQYMHHLVSNGYIGHCYQANFRFIMGYARQPVYLWRYDPQRANGVLGDLGVHAIDWAHWLVGPITAVSAHLENFVTRPGPEGEVMESANDSVLLLTQFEGGAHGLIEVSAVAHQGSRVLTLEVALYGDGGTLELHASFAPNDVEIRGAPHGEEIQPLPVPERFSPGMSTASLGDLMNKMFTIQPVGARLFIDAIRDGRPATPDFFDGWKAQQVIDAALESHRSQRWVVIAQGEDTA